jgi:hypothetical protein
VRARIILLKIALVALRLFTLIRNDKWICVGGGDLMHFFCPRRFHLKLRDRQAGKKIKPPEAEITNV